MSPSGLADLSEWADSVDMDAENVQYPIAGAEPDLRPRTGTVCVSGAATSIGQALAKRFLIERWHVVAVDYNPKELNFLQTRFGELLSFVEVDPFSSSPYVELPDVLSDYPDLCHVFSVSSGAQASEINDVRKVSPNLYASDVSTQVTDAAQFATACLPSLKKANRTTKSIIFTIMPNAIDSDGEPSRIASVSAMSGLVKLLARDLGEEGIRVGGVIPGQMKTFLAEQLHKRNPQYFEDVAAATSLGKLATAHDVVDAIYALALSLHAVTGAVLHVDSGAHLDTMGELNT